MWNQDFFFSISMLLLSYFKATVSVQIFSLFFLLSRNQKCHFIRLKMYKNSKGEEKTSSQSSITSLCVFYGSVYNRRWEWCAKNAGKYGNELQCSFVAPPPGHKTSIYRLTNAVSPRILFSNRLNLVFPLPKVVHIHCSPWWCLRRRSGGSDPITKPVDSVIMNFE